MSHYVSVRIEQDEPIKIGLHKTWDDCEKLVKGMPAAFGKKFSTLAEADAFGRTLRDNWNEWQRIIRLNQMPTAYVDGGCKVKAKIASWGLCIMSPEGKTIHTAKGIVGHGDSPMIIPKDSYEDQRQISGELYAATQASEWAVKNNQDIILAYDYVGILYHAKDIWPPKNTLQHWYKNRMNPVRPYVQSWRWVRGHSGIPGNELADQLSTQALMEWLEQNKE